MKKKTNQDLTKKFKNEKIDRNRLNYLVGGDSNGSEGSTDDPWI